MEGRRPKTILGFQRRPKRRSLPHTQEKTRARHRSHDEFHPGHRASHTVKASGFDLELPTAPGIEKGALGIRPVHYGAVGGDAITIRVDPNLEGGAWGPDAPQG